MQDFVAANTDLAYFLDKPDEMEKIKQRE